MNINVNEKHSSYVYCSVAVVTVEIVSLKLLSPLSNIVIQCIHNVPMQLGVEIGVPTSSLVVFTIREGINFIKSLTPPLPFSEYKQSVVLKY